MSHNRFQSLFASSIVEAQAVETACASTIDCIDCSSNYSMAGEALG